MLGSETTLVLRSVLNEVCEDIGVYENGTRALVASKLLEAVAQGSQTVDELKKAGREALQSAWRR